MSRAVVPVLRGMVLSLAAGFFFVGSSWGLPTRASDPFLFGAGRAPWTGAHILALAGGWDEPKDRGADVAAHPPLDRTRPLVINGTDAERAAIVRRYRLYSNQPDEMITFQSLARMRPAAGDLDPRLFQYGGAWVYPVGAIIKVASRAGLIQLRGDVSFYLDHPEAFGQFYLAARFYSAAWGLLGVVLIFELARAWSDSVYAGMMAGALYSMMPVVVNAAHEAKPHLAGSVLVLATLWAATRYVGSGRRGWVLAAAVLAGGAASMVWTGAAALAVLPMMFALRPTPARSSLHSIVAAVGIALLVFVVLNPYLPIDLVLHRRVVFSNVGNSTAMYDARLTVAGVTRAVRLLGEAMNPVVAAAAVLSLARLAFRCRSGGRFVRHPSWLAAGPAVLVAGQFVLLATAKPAEYARFSMTLDLLFAIALAAACANLRLRAVRDTAAVIVLVLVAGSASAYLRHFRDDRPRSSSRARTAAYLATQPGPVFIHAEPAPYCLPPVNLFDREIVLLPAAAGTTHSGGVDVIAVDQKPSRGWAEACLSILGWSGDAPITWADKPFIVHSTK